MDEKLTFQELMMQTADQNASEVNDSNTNGIRELALIEEVLNENWNDKNGQNAISNLKLFQNEQKSENNVFFDYKQAMQKASNGSKEVGSSIDINATNVENQIEKSKASVSVPIQSAVNLLNQAAGLAPKFAGDINGAISQLQTATTSMGELGKDVTIKFAKIRKVEQDLKNDLDDIDFNKVSTSIDAAQREEYVKISEKAKEKYWKDYELKETGKEGIYLAIKDGKPLGYVTVAKKQEKVQEETTSKTNKKTNVANKETAKSEISKKDKEALEEVMNKTQDSIKAVSKKATDSVSKITDSFFKEAPSKKTVSGNSVSENSVSDNSIPKRSVSDNSLPKQSVSDNSIPKQSVSDNSLPKQSVSDNSLPSNSSSEKKIENKINDTKKNITPNNQNKSSLPSSAVIAMENAEKAAEKRKDNTRNSVVNYATQFLGNPYVYGGASLTKGTDCSGFVMSVYKQYGIQLPHSSSAIRNCGTEVDGLENAKPGDVICYDGHVAIYMGDNKIVHASTEKTGIKISNNPEYRKIKSIRRMIN